MDVNNEKKNTESVESTSPNKPEQASNEIQQRIQFEDATNIDYAQLLDEYYGSFKKFSEGDVIRGRIINISESKVTVDIGFKSEGVIPIEEFEGENGKVDLRPGQDIDVYLEQTEDQNGYISLSREKAERMKIWDEIEKAFRDNTVITGRVIERIKGGLAVDIGVRAFLPGSQIDVRPVRNLDALRGEEFRMKVIKVNRRRGNIVLSRKVVLETELEQEKKRTLETLTEGCIIEGVVKNITEYGAFIDLGGIDGLLHITDMSYGRVKHPSEKLAIGEKVKVKVIKFDRAENRVSLGLKQMSADPWETAAERYPKNSRVFGKVVNITEYGAFVELEPGVEGLIHISEMTWNKRIKHPSKILNEGEQVEAQVLEIDSENRRISLGIKQTEPNPWHQILEKYAIGSLVTGKVRNLTEFGAFVEIEEGIDGLVHVSDMSWTKRIKHPSEVLKKGDTVNAVILSIDSDSQKISLGIKQLEPDRWEDFASRHQIGDVVKGNVVRITNFGAFVQLADGIEGLCHVSELDERHVEKPEEILKPGQEIDMRIIKMNISEKKIGLSLKAMKEDDTRIIRALAESEPSPVTMGDRVGDQLKDLLSQRRTDSE